MVLEEWHDGTHSDSADPSGGGRRPALAALRDQARAPAYFATYEDGEIVVKAIQDSPRHPRIDMWVGFRDAAHATALGKCILACLGSEQVRDYMARHPLHQLTSHTI